MQFPTSEKIMQFPCQFMRVYLANKIGFQKISLCCSTQVLWTLFHLEYLFHKINVILKHIYQIKADGCRNKAYGYTYAKMFFRMNLL